MTDAAGRADGAPSARVRLRRKPSRGRHDRAAIDAILDDALLGHVGWVRDGQPYVTPTAVWRRGDHLYWHASVASGMARATAGAPVCVTVSHLDGLVLARSGFDHSVNYRSVMVLGTAELVADPAEARAALEAFVDHVVPGRAAGLRPVTANELTATTVLRVDLREASAKVRAEGAHGDPADAAWPTWAGVIPLRTVAGVPEPEPDLPAGLAAPRPHVPGNGRTA